MADHLITFEGFRFDIETGELSGPNGVIRLGPQPARLLALLVEAPGALLTRDKLKLSLWPDTVVEADQGLNFCVLQLRTALGDDAGSARFIETLPRRGYRFIAKIDAGADPAAELLPAAHKHPALSLPTLIALSVVGVCVLAAAWAAGSAARGENRNVAIMPLISIPGDPTWISDVRVGVTDRLVSQMTAQAPGKIGVVGPLTTERFTNDPVPITEIGRALNVGYVISGATRVSDSTLFVQMVRTADGVHTCAFRVRAFGVNLDTLVAAIVTAAADAILKNDARRDSKFECARR